jgi:hypothetical protein
LIWPCGKACEGRGVGILFHPLWKGSLSSGVPHFKDIKCEFFRYLGRVISSWILREGAGSPLWSASRICGRRQTGRRSCQSSHLLLFLIEYCGRRMPLRAILSWCL